MVKRSHVKAMVSNTLACVYVAEIQQAYEKYLANVPASAIAAYPDTPQRKAVGSFSFFLSAFNISMFFGLIAGGLQILGGNH